MRVRLSIPDEIFEQAERLARGTRRSHSELYSVAMAEYLARHSPDEVTEAMTRVVDEVEPEVDEFVAAAARRTLQRSEW